MNYILTFLLVLVGSNIKLSDVKEYPETGHSQFLCIDFYDDDNYLINDLSDNYIKAELNNLKPKLFGSRQKIFNEYAKAWYVSDVIFSRSNKTREEYTFTYNTQTIVYNKVSVSVSGNIDLKGVLKFGKKELSIKGDFSAEREKEEYEKTTESGKLNVVVYPNKKITLRIVGDCKVTNGIKKNYFLGICVKKGSWELITVSSVCYELVEEDA